MPLDTLIGAAEPAPGDDTVTSAAGAPTTDGNGPGGRRCGHLTRLLNTLGGGAGTGTDRLFGLGAAAMLTHTGPIGREAARLLACDAALHRVVLGPASLPLDVGRAQRTVSPAIRRALHVRDGGCAFPGCDRQPGWCTAHHITHWADGGETSLDNCVLLCRRHHATIHHTAWSIRAVPGGRPIFTRPDGTDLHPPEQPRAG